MITAENRVGRLIEVRYLAAGQLQDHQALNAKVYALLAGMTGRAVFCTDMRKLDVLSDDLADRLAKAYRVANSKVERTAVLVKAKSKISSQMLHIIDAAGHDYRRLFTEVAAAQEWLSEVLSDDEQRRLSGFVAGR